MNVKLAVGKREVAAEEHEEGGESAREQTSDRDKTLKLEQAEETTSRGIREGRQRVSHAQSKECMKHRGRAYRAASKEACSGLRGERR